MGLRVSVYTSHATDTDIIWAAKLVEMTVTQKYRNPLKEKALVSDEAAAAGVDMGWPCHAVAYRSKRNCARLT
ncbi:hypothetical protein D3C84_1259880 [compost metagenome]